MMRVLKAVVGGLLVNMLILRPPRPFPGGIVRAGIRPDAATQHFLHIGSWDIIFRILLQ